MVFTFGTLTTDRLNTTPEAFKTELIQQSIKLLETRKLNVLNIKTEQFWKKICLAYAESLDHFFMLEYIESITENQKMKAFFDFAIGNINNDIVCTLPKINLPEIVKTILEPEANNFDNTQKNLSVTKDVELQKFIDRMKKTTGVFNL